METTKIILQFTRVLIWPLVTLTILITLRESIRALLRRINKGTLPGGIAFEASDVHQIDTLEQKQKLENEVREVAASRESDFSQIDASEKNILATEIELAETLALKDIELECDGHLRRQVNLYGNTFDAVSWSANGVRAIEVKLVGKRPNMDVFRELFSRAQSVGEKYYKHVFSFLLILITKDMTSDERESIQHKIAMLKRDSTIQIEIRSYDMSSMQRRYGVG